MKKKKIFSLLIAFCFSGGFVNALDIDKADLNFAFSPPDSEAWKILMNGVAPNTKIYIFGESESVDQKFVKNMSVIVTPSLPDYATLDLLKDGWEKGFLKKASKKLSSDSIQVDGIPAYRVVAEAELKGYPGEMVAVLVVYKGNDYNFGMFHVGAGALDDPDFKALLASVKFKQ